ncbi:MAG: hypothetical protein JRN39_06735 [Nitrososphaerota archaeon]|nr:hypothetical protein [Nitrososphaerota archaeon]
MPQQIFDSKTFKRLMEKAEEVRVVRSPETVKLKVKTRSRLYTYLADPPEADKLLKNAGKPVKELGSGTEKRPKKKSADKEEKVDEGKE